MSGPRTFWHLEAAKRVPTASDVAPSKLHYYPARGFEVDVPVKDWYERYQRRSPLTGRDLDEFVDPRQTTYSKYVELQTERETYLDGVFEQIEQSDYDRTLPAPWLSVLDDVVPQLRYLFHGLQMAAAYVGQMAPGGRVTMAAAFQAADEMRRIQRLAYRMRQLQETVPGFGAASKAKWERDAAWQPLRRLVETLLVTYDWGEAIVALNLVVKPLVDRLFHDELALAAKTRGDFHLATILAALGQDCAWHRQWSEALLEVATRDAPEAKAAVADWTAKWRPLAVSACDAAAELFAGPGSVPS